MGNRAFITTEQKEIAIYLHWNGGRDSVEAFLKYCHLKGFRSPETDGYGFARLAQIIGNYFGGGLSLGIYPYSEKIGEDADNGTYIIKNWEIVGREDFEGTEQQEYNLYEMLQDIDKAQPKDEQLGELLTADIVETKMLKVGDYVVMLDSLSGKVEKHKIIGIGKDEIVNGRNVLGIPYIGKWGDNYAKNPNNYIYSDLVSLAKKPENTSVKEIEVSINKQLNGIELKFTKKPIDMTREELKKHGFRWHSKKCIWYAKKTPENIDFIKSLTGLIVE